MKRLAERIARDILNIVDEEMIVDSGYAPFVDDMEDYGAEDVQLMAKEVEEIIEDLAREYGFEFIRAGIYSNSYNYIKRT
jgi:CRISPR/Cas system-associated protein Cas7 (RAMP superfamily)